MRRVQKKGKKREGKMEIHDSHPAAAHSSPRPSEAPLCPRPSPSVDAVIPIPTPRGRAVAPFETAPATLRPPQGQQAGGPPLVLVQTPVKPSRLRQSAVTILRRSACHDNSVAVVYFCGTGTMRLIPPIAPDEFFHHLQRCIPPFGWSPRIGRRLYNHRSLNLTPRCHSGRELWWTRLHRIAIPVGHRC